MISAQKLRSWLTPLLQSLSLNRWLDKILAIPLEGEITDEVRTKLSASAQNYFFAFVILGMLSPLIAWVSVPVMIAAWYLAAFLGCKSFEKLNLLVGFINHRYIIVSLLSLGWFSIMTLIVMVSVLVSR